MTLGPSKILIVKNRAMGDSILGLSSFQYLKSLSPNISLHYAIPSWIVPLYQKVESKADHIFGIETKSLKGQFSFLKKCWAEKYDLIIELHQSGSSGKLLKFFSFISSTPYFFHNHHLQSGSFIKDQGKIIPNIQRDLNAVWSILSKKYHQELKIPSYLDHPPLLNCPNQNDDHSFGIIGVVATRETKMWPLNYYIQLCHLLLKAKMVKKILIPLSHSAFDLEIEKKLQGRMPLECFIIKEPLEEIPLKMKGAKFYVGNDTGLKHLAAALEIPTFTFFGPEDPLEWHPYSQKKHPYFFQENLECRTRLSHFCPLSQCDSMICLNEIKTEKAFDLVNQFFKKL